MIMKGVLKFAVIAFVAMAMVSCDNSSIVGAWNWKSTDDYDNRGELDMWNPTDDMAGWGFEFYEDGTGLEFEEYLGTPIYWTVKRGWLYYDYEPITEYDKEYALKIVDVTDYRLKLREYYEYYNEEEDCYEDGYYEEYTFVRAE